MARSTRNRCGHPTDHDQFPSPADIVSDLLDQGQMEAGKLALRVRPFRPPI